MLTGQFLFELGQNKKEESKIEEILEKLKEKGIVDFIAKNNDATITFNEVREDDRTINRVVKYLEAQNNLKKEQLKQVVNYVTNTETCKSRLILEYFGEKNTTECGICSYCIAKKNKSSDTKALVILIIKLLSEKAQTSRELLKIVHCNEKLLIFALQELLDEKKIKIAANNKYTIV